MFSEDLSPFFDVAGGFALSAMLTPAGGGAAVPGAVLFDEAGEVLDGDVVSMSPTAQVPAATWPAAKPGDVLSIGARNFAVRQVLPVDDGAVVRLVLARL